MEENKTYTYDELVGELESCYRQLGETKAVLTEVKKELRRNQVQIDSLKAENDELKNRFAKIENNPIGALALKIYRKLRFLLNR